MHELMGWPGPMTWLQYECHQVWSQVKGGMRLDLDMDGCVPKEKQEEWKRILAEIPYRRLGMKSGDIPRNEPLRGANNVPA